jgi:hypothetical protein
MSNAQAAFEYFVSQGMTPAQAAGIVGNLQGESGQGLNTGSINPGDGRDGSDSIGIAQWNGTRAQALKAYADSKGVPWTDLNTQLEFLHSELRGPEASAYKGLQAAQTPEEAARAMLAYERPKDWNKPGSHPERAKYAVAAYSAYGGSQPAQTPAQPQPAQPATAAPANGLLAQAPAPAPGGLGPPAAGGLLQAPIFPQQAPQQAAPADPGFFAQIPAEQAMQAPPIQFAQRRPVNLAALRNTLAQRAPFFARG